MKLFLRILGIMLVFAGVIPCIYIACINWKESEFMLWLNHWKVLLPSCLVVFGGLGLIAFSNR